MRKLLIALGGLVILAVLAVLIVPGLIDWGAYKPQIRDAARDATGRDLTIGGDISLSIIPSPTLSVADVRLANIDGGSEPSMVSLDSLDVNVALLPLLSGKVQVTSVTLVRPVILLETLGDGRTNWTFDPATDPTATSSVQAGAGDTPGDGPSIALDRADIEDGTLIYRDAVAGTEHRLSDINVTVSAGGLRGPFDVEGSLGYGGFPMTVSAAVGSLDGSQATTIKLEADVDQGRLALALTGALDLDRGPFFTGQVSVEAADLTRVAELATAFGATAVPGLPQGPASMVAALEGSPSGMEARDLTLTLDDARFQGRADIAVDPRISVDVSLSGNRLDLDRFLGSDSASAKAQSSGGTESAPVTDAAGTAASDGPTGGLPTGIDARVEFKVDAVQYRGASIRNVQLDVSLQGGVGDLRLATAQLPGGTDVTVIGGVENTTPPVFKGRVEAASDNLRGTLEWLEVDLVGVPADRLRKAALSAAVDVSATEISVSDWSMEVDATQAQGGLTLALRDRPAFGLSLAIDRVNLDAYRSADPSETAQDSAPAPGSQGAVEQANPLAVLDTFDANIDLRAGEVTLLGVPVTDARLDALLQGGTLTLRDVRVADLAGARGVVSGVLRDAARQPSVDLDFDLTVEDVDRFARTLSTEVPIPPAQLGQVSLKGSAAGDMADVAVDLELAAAGGVLTLKGTAEPLAVPPALDLEYSLSHPDANRMAGVLAPGSVDGLGTLGPLQSGGSLRTEDGGRYALVARVSTGGAELSVSGSIDDVVAAPRLAMDIGLRHPNVTEAIRLTAPDYRPRGGDLGALDVNARVDGTVDALDVGTITLTAGGISMSGSGTLTTSGPRPSVALALDAGRIEVDPWLPPDQPTPQGAVPAAPVPAGGQSWSRDRIDTSVLSAADADIRASIEAIVFGAYEIDAATLVAVIKDGVLDVSQVSGGMFGGSFDLTAMLADRPTPEAAVTVQVRDADVRQAAATAAQTDMVSGILSYDTELSARGVSEYDLVSTLAGTGSFDVRDGTVQGFDLRSFSDRLGELNGIADFVDLTQRALQGGQTAFRTLSGTYTVARGVLRSSDIALDADAATGQATAVIDLPPRQMDVNARARLTDHGNAPPVGVRLVGPIDNPRRILDIDEMQRHIAQQIGTRALRQIDRSGTLDRLLGPERAPADGTDGSTPTDPAQPTQPVRPEDAVRGLLRGILNQ